MNQKKTYDDISFQNRKKLIYLIDEEKWTIKAAAHQIGIKLCTAKHILYLYRKQGKIYSKKGEFLEPSQTQDKSDDVGPHPKVVYVPYPYFIFCCVPPEQISISLEHLSDK